MEQNQLFCKERLSYLFELLLYFLQLIDGPPDINEGLFEEGRYIKPVGFMVVVIKFELLFLIEPSLQKLAVDLFPRLKFLNDLHSPAVNDEDRVLGEGKQKPGFNKGVLAEPNKFLAEKVMGADVDACPVPDLPYPQPII